MDKIIIITITIIIVIATNVCAIVVNIVHLIDATFFRFAFTSFIVLLIATSLNYPSYLSFSLLNLK